MQTDKQSIAPEHPHGSSPEISGTERQRTLPTGPTGRVHLGGGGVPWAKRCALSTAPSPSSKLLFMVLASFVNGPDEAAWPSQSTLAEMTGLTVQGVRNATKQLEAAGRIRVERKGGDKGIRYWLEAQVTLPPRVKSVGVEGKVSLPEVRTSEGTNDKAAAQLSKILDLVGLISQLIGTPAHVEIAGRRYTGLCATTAIGRWVRAASYRPSMRRTIGR